MRIFLTRLMATVKGKPRYWPDIEWSKKSYTHNFFRVLEWLFGRETGIRKESSSWIENGEVKHICYTLEAQIAYFETSIRELFDFSFMFLPSFNWQLGAIAHDAVATSGAASSSPITWSHTCTGSNLLIALCGGLTSGTGSESNTAASYNSVAATKAIDLNKTGSGFEVYTSIWLLNNPSTGSNTCSLTCTFGSINNGGGGISTSYTGVKQTSTADATGSTSNSGVGTGSQSCSITTVASNCWIIASTVAADQVSTTITEGQTQRGNELALNNNQAQLAAEDTNAAVSSGSNSMSFTYTFGNATSAFTIVAASIAPLSNTSNFFSFFHP